LSIREALPVEGPVTTIYKSEVKTALKKTKIGKTIKTHIGK